MTRRRPHLLALRSVAALGVAATLAALTAPMSHAGGLPEPVSTAVGSATSAVKGATGGLGLPVPSAPTTVPTTGLPTGTLPTGAGSTTATSGPSSTGTAQPGNAGGTPSSSTTSPRPGSGASPAPGTGNGAVVDSPAATVCLIPTGTSSPAVEVDLEAAGVDLSSPLVKQFPQALAPCPRDAVPAGDHVLSVDAAIKGLLGACVRVTRQVVPVQTTLVVLDRDLITELTKAGVPLDRLVVPCPRGATAPPTADAPTEADPGRPAASSRPAQASALPAGLAFTGSDSVPLAMVGAGLVWLGVLLTRRARAAFSTDEGRG